MQKCVIKLGGSVLVGDKPNRSYIQQISSVLRALNKRMVLGVVVGGGKVNSNYVDAARALGANNFTADLLGIDVTRLNARLLGSALGLKEHVPTAVEEAAEILQHNSLVVMGGVVPGLSTAATAALLAECTGARLVVGTNVDGVYDKDPNKYKGAKKYSKIKSGDFVMLAAEGDKRRAREHFILDLIAAKIIARSGIEAHVVNGTKIDEVKKAAQGKKHNGTVIV